MDFNHLYMQADGRIGRKSYWIGAIILGVISFVVTLALQFLLGVGSTASNVVLIIWQIVLAYPAYNLIAKRFHDRNRPTAWALYVVIAFVALSILSLLTSPVVGQSPGAISIVIGLVMLVLGVWLLIELGFLRGTIGPNEYGPDPVGP